MQVMREHVAPTVATGPVGDETLTQYLARAGKLPALQGLALAVQLLSALQAAHCGGVVHGAIHPGNLRVSRTGRLQVVGLEAPPGSATQLAPAKAYLAPEQRWRARPDARSDLYAAALVTHELLAGALPSARQGESAPVPPAWQAVFDRALANDPGARYPNAGALSAALQLAVGPPHWDRSTLRLPALVATQPEAPKEARAAPVGPMEALALATARSQSLGSARRRRLHRLGPALAAGCAAAVLLVAALMNRDPSPAPAAPAPAEVVGEAVLDKHEEQVEEPAPLVHAAAVPPAAWRQPSALEAPSDAARAQPSSASEPSFARPLPPVERRLGAPPSATRAAPERVGPPGAPPRRPVSARQAQRSHTDLACNQSLRIARDWCQAVRCSKAEFTRHPVCQRLQAQHREIEALREWRGAH